MKKLFGMLLPFVALLLIFCVQRVAIGSIVPKDDPVSFQKMPERTVAVDTFAYATPEELGKARGEYRYVSKGGIEKAKVKGQKVVDELDTYILKLDKQIAQKKEEAAMKEKELSLLKSTVSKPVITSPKVTQANRKPLPIPNDDENY